MKNETQRLVSALRCGVDLAEWKRADLTCQKLFEQARVPEAPADLPFNVLQAHTLYQKLFGTIDAFVRDKRLLVSSYGPLATFPIHALVTSTPNPHGNQPRYRDVAWLGKRQASSVLPSVAGLISRQRKFEKKMGGNSYGGFGNPLLDGDIEDELQRFAAARAQRRQRCDFPPETERLKSIAKVQKNLTSVLRGGQSDITGINSLPPLPDTADEICTAAMVFGKDNSIVNIGGNFNEARLRELDRSGEMRKFSVLHFATHGLMAYDTEKIVGTRGEPALVLTPPKSPSESDDGLLTASEISSMRLAARWVVLSACNTVAAEQGETEVLSGLAKAFFFAGVQSLLASHWAVDSFASKLLVTDMLSKQLVLDRGARAQALRGAMLRLINRADQAASHPATWAPFVVVESGAK